MRSLFLLFVGLFYLNITWAQLSNIETEALIYKKIDTTALKLHVYYPPNYASNNTYKAIIFFHGGGWNSGSYKAFNRQARYFASHGMITFSAEYRITNIHKSTPFESVEDAKSAIRYIRKNATTFGIDPNMIAAGGGSAGGHLAAVCGNIVGLEGANEDLSISSKPNALVLFNPVYDNSKNGYGYRRFKEDFSKISPLHNISEGAPPTIVFFGTEDKTTPVASSLDYEQKMKEVGSRIDLHLYEGQPHSFFNRPPYFQKTLHEAHEFLKSLGYIDSDSTVDTVFP